MFVIKRYLDIPSSLNWHLIMVEGFELCPWKGLPKQTGPRWRVRLRSVPKSLLNKTTTRKCTPPGMASLGPHPGARPGVGARRRAPGGRVFAHGTRLGAARTSDVGPSFSRLTTRRRVQKGPVQCDLDGSCGWGPQQPNPWMMTLAMGTCKVTLLGERSLS